jgi:hypothetical protein
MTRGDIGMTIDKKTKPRSDLSISRGLENFQLRSVRLAVSQITLVAGRSPGSTAARVNRSRTVRTGVGADRTHGGSTAGGSGRSRSTGDSRGSTADGGGSRTVGSDGRAAASTDTVADHGGSTADPSGSGAARVNSGGSTAGDRGGSRTGRGGSTGRAAARAAATVTSTEATEQPATLVAAGAMAPLLHALRASRAALRPLAAARRGSGIRRSRGTAAGRGSRTSVAGGDFSNSGTHEQNGGRESCPLHVWYYSWKGTSGTETVANPRDTGKPHRNQPFAGRKLGCRFGYLNLTPIFSSPGAVPHQTKGLCFVPAADGGTVVSKAPRTRGRCNSQIQKPFASPQGQWPGSPGDTSAAEKGV